MMTWEKVINLIRSNIFKLEDIFTIVRGERQTEASRKEGTIPYYSASQENNGITDFISNPTFTSSNKIVVSTFCHAYWAEGVFSASDEMTLLGHNKLNKYNALYICKMIEMNSHMYGFNRKAFSHRLKKQKILLPTKKDGSLDWDFMENKGKEIYSVSLGNLSRYIQNKYNQLVNKTSSKNTLPTLNQKSWAEFVIEDIVDIKSGVRLTKDDQKEGNIPFIGATEYNNGVTAYVSNTNSSLDSNVVGVNYNGAVVESFYHPYKAIFSDDVKRIKLKDNIYRNKYVYLFLITMIKMQKKKYMYSYKFNAKRMKKQKILLPINNNKEPDWEYMGNYMKVVEYKQICKLIEYLD